jgi:LPS export ABC transporter permease LptG/LPS export ABC transporter permease LptF
MLLPRYVVVAMLPYVFLSLVLLTSVLFAQQAARFAEVVIYADLPVSLLGHIGAALLPGVLIFTIPLATLAGIIVGYSRMGSDSELIAMRAAGVGSWTMLWPALLLGVVLCASATYIHLAEAPRAARDLERAALQSALAKLDSPVDPRTFSTLPKYVIYVRDGDKAQGTWGRVFISTQDDDNSTEILTARAGRIDSSGDRSELVLTDVVATKLSPTGQQSENSFVVERSEQLRISINTGRAELVQRLNQRDTSTDSLEWNELRKQAASEDVTKRRAAQRTLHRRLALSVSPLVFSFLGGALGLRIRRGGRSVGVLLTLIVVIVYYLLSLLGESLSRAGSVSPIVGGWLATAFMIVLSFVLLMRSRNRFRSIVATLRRRPNSLTKEKPAAPRQSFTVGIGNWGFPSLLDASLLRSLFLSFLICFFALAAIFNIFTLFELWRFIAANNVAASLVARYLFFLLPLISVEMFPATMLISVLVTYALLARRREAIAWWASGQSVYRLMFPGLLFAVAIGGSSWLVQEHLMPSSNLKQDALRARIRGGEPRAITGTGRQWLASTTSGRLYSYEFDSSSGQLIEPSVYEFDNDSVHLQDVISGKSAAWKDPSHLVINDAEVLSLKGLEVQRQAVPQIALDRVETPSVFQPTIDKPSQLSSSALTNYIDSAKQRGSDVSALAVALQRKYAAPFGILIMALIGMPLAISFGRKGTIIALCIAVGVSVAYWVVGGGFQQLGNLGLLRPTVAGWSPLLIFAAAGTYFLSRVRT